MSNRLPLPGMNKFLRSRDEAMSSSLRFAPFTASRRNAATVLVALAACLTPLSAAAQAAGAGGGAAGAGSATSGAAGAAAQSGAATAAGANAAASGAGQVGGQTSSSNPVTYAAGAAPGADPRKPPASKPGALTLQQVIDRARQDNPTLLAGEQNLRATRAQEIQAGVRVNPNFGVAGSNVTLDADGMNPYSYSAQVSRLFERGNKRTYRLANARATTSQTEALLADTARQTELAVRESFTTMLIAKQALQLSQAQLADFRHQVEVGKDRYQAGDLGKLDYLRLDLQLGSSESDEQNAEIAVAQASDRLQTLMGIVQPTANFDITGDIVPPLVVLTREQLLAQALQTRPDLRAAQSAIVAADAAQRLAIANGTADPTLEGEYDKTGHDNSAGFSVNVPLRLFDRNQGNKETARLQAQGARLTAQAMRNQVASDVAQAYIAYTHAKTLSDRFSSHYLDESAEVLSIARFSFDHGGAALIDYLDALREARSTTSDALNAYSQTWMAIHQLSAATGTNLLP